MHAGVFAALLLSGLCACAPNVDVPPAEPPRICPADGYLDCMPIVPAESRTYCSADYRNWIVKNCPNVEIVY
jgi:hypothetical protein